ncbi:MAG: hypothetical protein Q9M91_03350 [Candidatus Dojkabacteria bacterium]|nr:hypothetical protein [Candidatus Dojkabacteria bacterium]MDQ7020860.1 hypothetical protein [Candidatus Dojkabacteria bacterium]
MPKDPADFDLHRADDRKELPDSDLAILLQKDKNGVFVEVRNRRGEVDERVIAITLQSKSSSAAFNKALIIDQLERVRNIKPINTKPMNVSDAMEEATMEIKVVRFYDRNEIIGLINSLDQNNRLDFTNLVDKRRSVDAHSSWTLKES